MSSFPTFPEFFAALNGGRAPYLWQEQAATRLFEGQPFDAISVPTGLGKTQVLTAWAWAFARQRHEVAAGTRPAAGRTVQTRLHFLVDRRIVVDDVRVTALTIKDALEGAERGPLWVVAQALEPTRSNEGGLLDVIALRGGLAAKPQHTSSPFTPVVAVGTLDLVLSRLLWRGYGIGPGRRPIDAALVGVDSLIILDEAHIAEQALRTLRTLVAHRDLFNCGPLPSLSLVVMSATLRPDKAPAALIFDADREVAKQPDLGLRLRNRASTSISLSWQDYPATSGKVVAAQARTDLVNAMADQVQRAPAGPGTATVAFVNAVAHAHLLGAELEKRMGKAGSTVVVLHGGAPAPVTSDRLAAIKPFHNGADPALRAAAPHTVVVATQTLEVGADLDFDHAVIECPSLDALVQRIGRVNRGGRRTGASVQVVARRGDPSPVYGQGPIGATGRILEGIHTVGALQEVVDRGLPPGATRAPEPTLTLDRPTFDDYTFTLGLAGEPEVGAWIRPRESEYRVQVVWRDALNLLPAGAQAQYVRDVPARGWETWSMPPSALLEAFTSDIGSPARAGLSILVAGPDGDPNSLDVFSERADRASFAWALVPGATVYMPTGFGAVEHYTDSGLDLSGFRMTGEEPVVVVLADLSGPGVVTQASKDLDLTAPYSEILQRVRDTTRGWSTTPTQDPPVSALAVQANASLVEALRHVGAAQMAVTSVIPGQVWLVTSVKAREQRVGSGSLGLDEHLRDVGNRAGKYARVLGLDDALVEALRLAGARHDLGKMLPQFQSSLRYEMDGRDLVLRSVAGDGARAKSALPRWRWAEANRLARVPEGFRHEALSVALSDELGYPPGVDQSLVRHLIGTHHGYGRGMFHLHQGAGQAGTFRMGDVDVTTANTQQAGLSQEWSTQFEDLNVAQGAYWLAFLEAVLRLADWSVSAEVGGAA